MTSCRIMIKSLFKSFASAFICLWNSLKCYLLVWLFLTIIVFQFSPQEDLVNDLNTSLKSDFNDSWISSFLSFSEFIDLIFLSLAEFPLWPLFLFNPCRHWAAALIEITEFPCRITQRRINVWRMLKWNFLTLLHSCCQDKTTDGDIHTISKYKHS